MNDAPGPLKLANLLQRALELKNEGGWEPFREGIDIRPIYQTESGGPAAALLRYQPGARAPRHEHLGFEHIIVLEGSQVDEFGTYPIGSLAINRPGTTHTVSSPGGCVVLIIWERGVRFLDV